MTDAPNTSTYLLRSADPSNLPNSRVLAADATTGVALTDTGPSGVYTLKTLGNLDKIFKYSSYGFMTYNPGSQTFVPRSIEESTSINVTNADGTTGNPQLSVVPETTVQMIRTQLNGSARGTRPTIDFESGEHISIGLTDDGLNNKVKVRFDITGINSGTVTSVDADSPNESLEVTGGPITSEGTFHIQMPRQTDVTPGVYYNATVTVDEYGRVVNISDGEGPGGDTVTDVDWTMSPYTVLSDDQLINVTEVDPSQQMEIILPFATRGRGIIIKDTSNNLSNLRSILVTVEGEEVPSFFLEGPLTLEDEGTLTAEGFQFILEDGDIFELLADETLSGGTQIIGGTIDGQTSKELEFGYASLSVRGLSSTSNEWAIV